MNPISLGIDWQSPATRVAMGGYDAIEQRLRFEKQCVFVSFGHEYDAPAIIAAR